MIKIALCDDEKKFLKLEMKYIEDLNIALDQKCSKVEIANMLRRIMSYVILTNSPIFVTVLLKVVKTLSKKEMEIVTKYIIANNQYIAKLNRLLIQNDSGENNVQ